MIKDASESLLCDNGVAVSEAVMKTRTIKDGDHVKVVDEHGYLHDGLVTNSWGNQSEYEDGKPGPTVNVLFVSNDPAKRDQYGEQIERLSSCSHKLNSHAPGRYWFWPDESF